MKHSRNSKATGFIVPGGILTSFVAGLSLMSLEAAPPSSVDLSTYVLAGRHDLPEPTRTPAPSNSLLAQEASSITYNWDTDTLFVLGDGGTSVVQVSKIGELIDSMTLAPGNSSQGTTFFDTEGITYLGNGMFVLVEERDRQINLFSYVAGGILHRADVRTVKLGTTIGNIGLEGVSYDPLTGGFILVKEKDPISIFQTAIDFNAGTASNGSPTATSSADLFSPSLASLADFSDVFALANLPSLSGQPDGTHLLIISQESGQIVNIDRTGTVYSRLTITAPSGSRLSVPDMTMEGVTMDRDGILYVANENGGGDANHPQLWVYVHSDAPNAAPTGAALVNQVVSIPENTSTAAPIKVADISITDDGLGNNNLTLTGPDSNSFQIIGVALYLKAGTPLNAATKATYNVTVNVDDPSSDKRPDASVDYTLTITPASGGTPSLIISEIAPWSSGNSLSNLRVDWFEISNIGTAAQNIAGWKMDDDSHSFTSAVALNGITTIAPGESVIFLETADNNTSTINAKKAAFLSGWFGANPPPNLQIGNYSGSGVGLGTGGDAVNLYDSMGALRTGVTFGTSPSGPSFATFDNALGLNSAAIGNLSAVGLNGAFVAASDPNEIGSPGTIGAPTTPIVTIAAIDPNAAEVGSDPGIFRISRSGSVVSSMTVNYTVALGAGQATGADYSTTLSGVVTIPSGQSSVDLTVIPIDDPILEGIETITLTLSDTGSYDVGSPASATVLIADDVRPPAPQPGISVSRGGFVLDRRSGLFVQGDTLSNVTSAPILGPIYLLLDNLSPNAALSNSAGNSANTTPLGSPYILVLGANSSLAPGASVGIVLTLANPTRTGITYNTRVLSGGNEAP